MENAVKKNRNWTLISAIAWAASYIVFVFIVKRIEPPMAFGLLFVLLLASGFTWFLVNYIRSLASMDELQRRIQLEATAIGFCLSVLVTMVLGILDMVVELNNDNWNLQQLVAFFFLAYLGGFLWARKKYA